MPALPRRTVRTAICRKIAGVVLPFVLFALFGTAWAAPASATPLSGAASSALRAAGATGAPASYPPQGATWRRDGMLSLCKLTSPRQGSKPGPVRYAVGTWQELLAEMGFRVPRHSVYDEDTVAAVARLAATGGVRRHR